MGNKLAPEESEVCVTQHFTKRTVSSAFYCPKCEKSTQHRIDFGRKGPCLECIARLEAEFIARLEAEKAAAVEKQESLFGH